MWCRGRDSAWKAVMLSTALINHYSVKWPFMPDVDALKHSTQSELLNEAVGSQQCVIRGAVYLVGRVPCSRVPQQCSGSPGTFQSQEHLPNHQATSCLKLLSKRRELQERDEMKQLKKMKLNPKRELGDKYVMLCTHIFM